MKKYFKLHINVRGHNYYNVNVFQYKKTKALCKDKKIELIYGSLHDTEYLERYLLVRGYNHV